MLIYIFKTAIVKGDLPVDCIKNFYNIWILRNFVMNYIDVNMHRQAPINAHSFIFISLTLETGFQTERKEKPDPWLVSVATSHLCFSHHNIHAFTYY